MKMYNYYFCISNIINLEYKYKKTYAIHTRVIMLNDNIYVRIT